MNKELFARLYSDGCFKNFCSQIDQLRKQEYKISIPLETTTLLCGSGIGYIKEDASISLIHSYVMKFLAPMDCEVFKAASFYSAV